MTTPLTNALQSKDDLEDLHYALQRAILELSEDSLNKETVSRFVKYELPKAVAHFNEVAPKVAANTALCYGFYFLESLHDLNRKIAILSTEEETVKGKVGAGLKARASELESMKNLTIATLTQVGIKLKRNQLAPAELKAILEAHDDCVQLMQDDETREPVFPWSDHLRQKINKWLTGE